MFVKGVLVKDGHGNEVIHTSVADIQSALSAFWVEVYSKNAFDSDQAAQIRGVRHRLIIFV